MANDRIGIRGAREHNLKSIDLEMPREQLPQIDEQRAIVAPIATETPKIDAMRSATERTIELLEERRAALITAVAMGKMRLTTDEGLCTSLD